MTQTVQRPRIGRIVAAAVTTLALIFGGAIASGPALAIGSGIVWRGQDLSTGIVGQDYTDDAGAAGASSFALSIGVLPPGLSLARSGGAAGLPTEAGTWTFTTRASNEGGSVDRERTITISPAVVPTPTPVPTVEPTPTPTPTPVPTVEPTPTPTPTATAEPTRTPIVVVNSHQQEIPQPSGPLAYPSGLTSGALSLDGPSTRSSLPGASEADLYGPSVRVAPAASPSLAPANVSWSFLLQPAVLPPPAPTAAELAAAKAARQKAITLEVNAAIEAAVRLAARNPACPYTDNPLTRAESVPMAPAVMATLAVTGGAVAANSVACAVLGGLAPHSIFVGEVQSTPVTVASGTVDASGLVSIVTTLPDNLEPGQHRFIITAVAADGTPVTFTQWFSVTRDGLIGAQSSTGPVPDPTLTSELAATGSQPNGELWAALMLVGTGAALAGLGNLRRRRARV